MKLTINVTQDDIDHGTRCNPKFCAIARAVRSRDELKYASIGPDHISIYTNDDFPRKENPIQTIKLNEEVRKFIYTFDHGLHNELKPFSFSIEVPE